jgi:Tim44-like domain
MNRIFFWMVTAGIFCVHATVAYGRAGGGGGYSSGSSSSSGGYSSGSSSSSSGGGGGEATLFDFIVLILMTGFAIYMRKKILEKKASQLRLRRVRSDEIAAVLRARDPQFDSAAFTARVENAFAEIQEAWSTQDLGSVRRFMSDGLHERFSIQLREQAALGYRNPLSDLKILECFLVEAHAATHFDIVSVRISASAHDFRIDTRTQREIEGSRRMERFTEVWSFLRGRNAGTSPAKGLFEGQCPNCSAPIDPKRAWGCESCGSDLDQAPPDWVLTEITQQSEWKVRAYDEPEWLKAALSRDPGLTEQQLEDRASVLFWRLMDSERTGQLTELASVAGPKFIDARRAKQMISGGRYVGDCAVGAVQLRGILPGREWDLALVEIRWSGGTYIRNRAGLPVDTGARTMQRNLLVMARQADAKSTVGRCIVSAHCHRCGAPDEGALEGSCTFCGEALNDGSDWLIDRFLSMQDHDAIALLAEVDGQTPLRLGLDSKEAAASDPEGGPSTPRAPGGNELFAWALKLVYADLDFDGRERDGLKQLAKRLGIPDVEARKLQRAAQFGRLEIGGPDETHDTQLWIAELTAIAEVDGPLNRDERRTLEHLAMRAGTERLGF